MTILCFSQNPGNNKFKGEKCTFDFLKFAVNSTRKFIFSATTAMLSFEMLNFHTKGDFTNVFLTA